ncbi:hypothetical protein GCM10028773_47410 [Spirosoma koreense]
MEKFKKGDIVRSILGLRNHPLNPRPLFLVVLDKPLNDVQDDKYFAGIVVLDLGKVGSNSWLGKVSSRWEAKRFELTTVQELLHMNRILTKD